MSYRGDDRLDDIAAAITAIRSHLERGELTDGLVFDAVRIRLLEIGEAVKTLPAELLDREPEVARMRDHLAHRYWDTNHAIVQATVDNDLDALSEAVTRLQQSSGHLDADSDAPLQSP
jgi:uncharacterized protein with HEPN domain